MLLNEKINDLQKLTKKKISYEKVAKALGLERQRACKKFSVFFILSYFIKKIK